jgi:hypothetical protein
LSAKLNLKTVMTDNLAKNMQLTDRDDILLIVRIAEQAE